MRTRPIAALVAVIAAIVPTGLVTGDAPSPPPIIPETAFRPVEVGRAPMAAPVNEPELPTLAPRRPVVPLPADRPIVVTKAAPPKPAPAGGASVADAKAYALDRLGSTQYACLDQIATHESHWNPYDLNASSGAYGIPQAVPGSKMATAGSDWRTNPVTQVRWMIGYVDGRYGSACAAWGYWERNRWY